MSETLVYKDVHQDPDILGGKPVIAGTRISIELIMEKLAAGRPPQEICTSHALGPEAIEAALAYTQTLPENHPLSQRLQEYRALRRR